MYSVPQLKLEAKMQHKKRNIAWLIILVLLVIGVLLNKMNSGNSSKMSFSAKDIKNTKNIIDGSRERVLKQRFVSGESEAEDKILIINVQGELNNDRKGSLYQKGMVDEIIDELKQAENDEKTRAIILDINSPGGPVVDADILYGKIMELRKKKVIIAYLDRMAASGGYYIASACDKIVAHPLTITGSIGVIMNTMNVQGLLEKKLGIEMGVIKSGKFKDMGSPYRKMQKTERQMLQALVDEAYVRFVQSVADGRRMPFNKVAEVADGRIFSATQGKAYGLVDILGTEDTAVLVAKKLAGLKKAKVVEFYIRPSLRDLMFSKIEESNKMKDASTVITEPVLKYIWQPLTK